MNQKIFSNIKTHLVAIWNELQSHPDLWDSVQSNMAVTEQHLSDTLKKLKKYAWQEAEKQQKKMFQRDGW